MRIYVPSRGRYGSKFVKSVHTPLAWLTPALRARTVYVVRDEEVDNYRRQLPKEISVLGCGQPANLSRKRVWIALHAHDRGEATHCQIDDDVSLHVRVSDSVVNLRYPTPAEVGALFTTIENLLATYQMVGVSAREGNNHAGVGPPPLLRECTRSMRFYAFWTDTFLRLDTARLPEMADFDTTLQLLRSGHKNAVINYYAQDQPGSQLAGGCSVYRTAATHEDVAKRLQQLHPDFVALRTKQNKGAQAGFGTRTEVTVQWQKAFKSSQMEKVS